MKVKNFIPGDLFKHNGLVFTEMRNLKQVVAVFGVNGSGKSRLLRGMPTEIDRQIHEIFNIETKLEKATRIQQEDSESKESLEERRNLLRANIEFDDQNEQVISLTNRNIGIHDHRSMNESEFRGSTLHVISNPDFSQVKQNCTKFIKSLCRADLAKSHNFALGRPFYKAHDNIQRKTSSLFQLLKSIVKEIIGKDLDYFVDEFLTPIVTLNRRTLELGELSDGEKELLAYCTFLVLQSQSQIDNQALSLKNKVVVLDEIEMFLHPKAQIDLLAGLRRLVGENGQIWLATHSLAILSVLDRDEIWLMENGDIRSPSIETPNKVISSLLGENNVYSLENFLSSQYQWASIQFALECLFPPTVVSHKEGDAQQMQAVAQLTPTSESIHLLDFGAGKGRIAQELLRNSALLDNLLYQPLETNREFHSSLETLTKQLHQASKINPSMEREVLDTSDKLTEKKYLNYFDRVLMINVLHEIPLNKWHSTLNAILGCLKDSGQLIILEDQALPRGENAHEYGFLILDVEEIQQLFSRSDGLIVHKHSDPKYTGRLTCIEVPKIGSLVTPESIKNALKRKKINCKTAISRLREQKVKTAKDGRTNGFLTQLYANVDMALQDLG